MRDMLNQGLAWLAGQRHEHLAAAVEYERDGVRLALAATVGKTEFGSEEAYGGLVRTVSHDYLVRAGDLTIGGSRFEPRAGDLVHDRDATFEVMSPVGGPVWRWCDANRTTMRIHTKEV